MPCVNPILTSALPTVCDFVSSYTAFNRALDGAEPPSPASSPFIRQDKDEFVGGSLYLKALAKERNVDLPLEKWEGHKRYFNTVHISLLVLIGAVTWPVSTATLVISALMIVVPLRLGTLPLLALEPDLDSLDKKICGLRTELGALISELTNVVISEAQPGEITWLRRKKMQRATRDSQDKVRKKWNEMDEPLRDMRGILNTLAVVKYYFRSWIPRIMETLPNAVASWAFSKLPSPVWRNYTTIEKIFDRYRARYEDHLKAWQAVAFVLQLSKMAIKDKEG